jgi:hypothetical protein
MLREWREGDLAYLLEPDGAERIGIVEVLEVRANGMLVVRGVEGAGNWRRRGIVVPGAVGYRVQVLPHELEPLIY